MQLLIYFCCFLFHLFCFCLLIPSSSVCSKEKFQQCSSVLWERDAERRGWRGADSHQSVPQVSHNIPADPASSPGTRLQACAGNQLKQIGSCKLRMLGNRYMNMLKFLWLENPRFCGLRWHKMDFCTHHWYAVSVSVPISSVRETGYVVCKGVSPCFTHAHK